jgi:hypothetical protein
LFLVRRRFEMHPSAFVFGKGLSDRIAARCKGFFRTNGVEYYAWPMAAALARGLVHIDAPLIALGRTAKSWGSNLSLANPGKDRIQSFLADVEHNYRHAPLNNFTTANMWAEGVLTAKSLLPQELGSYEFDEVAYLSATARELKRRGALGVDVSRELDELARYVRKDPALATAIGRLDLEKRGLWQRLRSSIGDTGVRDFRRRLRANTNARNLRRGNSRTGFAVGGAAFGFGNVLEAAQFLARVTAPPAVAREGRALRQVAAPLS